MTKEQRRLRQAAIDELALAYPGVDAEKLQDSIYRVAVALANNAEWLCIQPDHKDQRPRLRKKLDDIGKEFAIDLQYETSGDPRCPPLRLVLPTGRSNSLDGRTWAISVQLNP